MKRLLIVFVFVLLLSGCSVNCEVELKGDTLKEKLTLIETDKSLFDVPNDTGWTLREIFSSALEDDEFSKKEYKVKSLTTDDRLGLEYSSNKAKRIENLSILNQCYSDYSIENFDGVITLDTGSDFECFDYYDNLDEVKVTFKTNHKVLSNNADEVNGNKYTWYITEDGNKQIKISYMEDYKKNNLILYLGLITLIILILIGAYMIYQKNKLNNEF